MSGEELLKLAMAKRSEAGLKLEWIVEDGSVFTAYPKNELQKNHWIEQAECKGWKLISA